MSTPGSSLLSVTSLYEEAVRSTLCHLIYTDISGAILISFEDEPPLISCHSEQLKGLERKNMDSDAVGHDAN